MLSLIPLIWRPPPSNHLAKKNCLVCSEVSSPQWVFTCMYVIWFLLFLFLFVYMTTTRLLLVRKPGKIINIFYHLEHSYTMQTGFSADYQTLARIQRSSSLCTYFRLQVSGCSKPAICLEQTVQVIWPCPKARVYIPRVGERQEMMNGTYGDNQCNPIYFTGGFLRDIFAWRSLTLTSACITYCCMKVLSLEDWSFN